MTATRWRASDGIAPLGGAGAVRSSARPGRIIAGGHRFTGCQDTEDDVVAAGEMLRRSRVRKGRTLLAFAQEGSREGAGVCRQGRAGPAPRHLGARHRRFGLSLTDRRGSLNRVAFASGTQKGEAALPPLAVSKDRHVPSHTNSKQTHPIFLVFRNKGTDIVHRMMGEPVLHEWISEAQVSSSPQFAMRLATRF